LLVISDVNPRDESELSPEDLSAEDDETELLKAELFHTHLPKLEGAGYIEWDRETQRIRRGPRFDEIAPWSG
jgi:hypothetical protein